MHLGGGGACWDDATCRTHTSKFTVWSKYKFTGPYNEQKSSMLRGWYDRTNDKNPLRDFTLVRVPYCTADIHAGNSTVNYGSNRFPYIIHHHGHRNFQAILEDLKRFRLDPELLVLAGNSAGGLGVTWNLYNVKKAFPKPQVITINDSGLLFKSPHISRIKLHAIFKNWGADAGGPLDTKKVTPNSQSPVIETLLHNQKAFPKTYYAFISSYHDYVMTLFTRLLRPSAFWSTVKENLLSVSKEEFSRSSYYKVYYVDNWTHSYYKRDPSEVTSDGVKLNDWMRDLLNRDNKTTDPTNIDDTWIDVIP